jgi:hypothetical protein
MRIKKMLLTGTVVALAAAMLGGFAAAGSTRTTKGDAQSVLEAFGNGGWAVLLHSKKANGSPSQGTPADLVAIRPLSGTPFQGKHYCALDWHTILLADIESGPQEDAAAIIGSLKVAFTLDSAPLATQQTAVKRFLNPERFGLTDAYYSQFGRVMAPSDLAPGPHTVGYVISDSSGPVDSDGITFYVDAAGTGVCL